MFVFIHDTLLPFASPVSGIRAMSYGGGRAKKQQLFHSPNQPLFQSQIEEKKEERNNQVSFLLPFSESGIVLLPRKKNKMQGWFSGGTSEDDLKPSSSLLADWNSYASAQSLQDDSTNFLFDTESAVRSANDTISGTFSIIAKPIDAKRGIIEQCDTQFELIRMVLEREIEKRKKNNNNNNKNKKKKKIINKKKKKKGNCVNKVKES